MNEHLELMTHALWGVWLSFSPFLALGALLAGLIHVALPQGFVTTYLSGGRGVWRAVLFGVPLPLCSCGVIPVGLGLKRDGASDGATMGFLISTPQTGVDSILVSGVALGWPFAFMKVVAASVTGIFGGLLIDRAPLKSGEANQEALASLSGGHDDEEGGVAQRLVGHALSVIEPIWGWVVVGVLASALIEVYLPASSLSGIGQYGALVAMGLSLSLSLPLYICATSSVPIAAALVAKGLPVGAALVFLMAGPATNLATMGVISKGLGRRFLAIYLTTIITGSVLFGLLFEAVWPVTPAQHMSHDHSATPWWSLTLAWLTLALFAWLAFGSARRWIKGRRATPSSRALTLQVTGVTCGGCVRKIERVVGTSEGVSSVVVRRDPDEVTIEGSLTEAEACALLQGAGFGVKGVS